MLLSTIKNIKKIKMYLYIKRIFSFSILVFSLSMLLTQFTNAQKLNSLIEIGLKNNPEIQKFELRYKIASEKINEVSSIPNTEFGLGYFISEPETRTGAQRFKVSARQMIPWFNTISARENYVSSLAESKYEDVVIAKRRLITSISQSYHNLYANRAKQNVYIENIEVLKTYKKLALTSVETGNVSVVDVLKLQMRQDELQQLFEVLIQEFIAEQTSLNKLLNRDNSLQVSVEDELMIPSESFEEETDSLELHPELLKFDKLYYSIEQSELLNQKESSPMIGFGLDYIHVEKRPNLDFNENGKDIIMPMLSLSIPIFNSKYKSKTKQNDLKQQEILAQKQEHLNKLKIRLERAIHDRNSARISYKAQAKNLIQAKNAQDILMKSYETEAINFSDVLDIQELQLKFQLNQVESVKKYYLQSTIINYLRQ